MHTEVSGDPPCVFLAGRDQSELFLLLLGTQARSEMWHSLWVRDKSRSFFCIEFYTVLYRKGLHSEMSSVTPAHWWLGKGEDRG